MSKWSQQKLKTVADVKHGFAFKSKFFTNKGKYVLLTPGNFYESGGFRWLGDKQKFYSGDIPNGYILKKDDLLVAMTEQAPGLLGSVILIPKSDKYLHNQRLALLQISTSRIFKLFLYHVFNSRIVRKPISETSAGTKVKHTSPEKIGNLYVPIPPMEHQTALAELLSIWDVAIEKTEWLIMAKEKRFKCLATRYLLGLVNSKALSSKKTRWFAVPEHWEIVKIEKIAKEVKYTNGSNQDIPVLSCTKYDGLVDSLAYFEKQVFSVDTSNYKVVKKGQFAHATNHIEEGSIGYQSLYPKDY